jgi:radical SAM/Cys-rich protein
MLDSKPHLFPTSFPKINRRSITTLQVNLGLKCNQQCVHCHVNASPKRTEMMSDETIELVLKVLANRKINTLDITGGAPELHEHFQYLVIEAKKLGLNVIDRCNLTILTEPDKLQLAQFLADQQVEIVASLPCYLEENVDQQRGKGVYQRSIEALKQLNKLGYGKPESNLKLSLVYNPQGTSLPPPQQALEADYRKQLFEQHGIEFSSLLTITNMPIKRFGSFLLSKNQFASYLELLKSSYQESNLEAVMCRDLISVDWQGYLYDCDFNQMLDMPITDNDKRMHLSVLLENDLLNHAIDIADHCYGCTAGQGSSCGGALA